MKQNNFDRVMIMVKAIAKVVLGIVATLSIITAIVSNQKPLFFSSLFTDCDAMNTEIFKRMIGSEIHYFGQKLDNSSDSLISNFMELATNVNVRDIRSFIYEELPGMFAFYSDIIVAGQGTDFTNLPIETPPPKENLGKDSELKEGVEIGGEKKQQEKVKQPEKNTVFIYHSHSRESFLPHLKNANPNTAQHSELNVTLLGKRLGEILNSKGIGTTVDTTDVVAKLLERNMEYWQSYEITKEVVQEAMARNKEYTYFIDIHRDSGPKHLTTININGKNYGKLYFIVGTGHKNYKKNEQLAIRINQMIEEKYPGLSRGVFPSPRNSGSNGIYNQNLSPNALLIEIGGVENTLEEVYNTIDVLGEIFAEFYWQDAVEVNG